MEVVHRRVEEEEEVVVMLEEQLLPRRRLADPRDDDSGESSDDAMNGGYHNVISDEKSVYFDDKKGIWKCHDCVWTHKIGQPWIYHLHQKPFSQGDAKVEWSEKENREEISKVVEDVMKVEGFKGVWSRSENVIVEESEDEEVIELEFERAADKVHTHTPYCPNCNNQITKVILRRKKKATPPPDKPLDLLGCLSCFTIFIPSGDCLNPFGLFKPKPTVETQHPPIALAPGSKRGLQTPSTTTNDAAAAVAGEAKPEQNPDHATVDINDGPEINGRSKSMEILKCIVYGGLIESIASLSIVSSAAASDATTLNVVVIGLATLLSGLIAFGCNLVELRNDITWNDKYEQVLGRRGHFLFHSTFATLSYLVFGVVAPTTYGFAFRDSDNTDYKILAVAAAAFACIFFLAIAKAYVKGTDRFGGYVKTVLSYVTLALTASGVAYAAGDLFGMLLDHLAWFQHPLSSNFIISSFQ